MIKLGHIKKCSSVGEVPESLNLDQKLNFCTDTRKYKNPSAFVAIPGAKINPLDVIELLLEQGCPVVFYQKNLENDDKAKNLSKKFPKTSFVSVSDSVIFLQELSREHITYWKGLNSNNTVFAISGCNGKTTHKEMLSFMLKSIIGDKLVSTEKNNNNHLGVPLTLLNVADSTEFIVLELGSNHPGEIKVLCDIARPNAGLTTNIGPAHLEFFGTEEKIFEEEGYLYHAIKEVTSGKGFYLINADDKFLKQFPKTQGSVHYGESAQAQAQIKFLEDGAQILYNGQTLIAKNEHITGQHNKLNLITSLFIAHHFYSNRKAELEKACLDFRPTKNRSEWIKFENRSVYLDAYNANPSSMKAALLGFKESVLEQGMKLSEACVVIGDMNELGESAPKYHQEVGAYINDLGFQNVYFIGRYSSYYLKGFEKGEARNSSAEFKNEYRNNCLKKFAIHFIKGSRSLQLESLFDIT